MTGSSAFYLDAKFKDSLAGRNKIYNLNTLTLAEYLQFRGKDVFVAKYGNLQTGIKHKGILPRKIELLQNYPNPFNPTTTIRYVLPKDGQVTLTVFDVRGRKIKTLVNTFQTAGYHSARWNGKDAQGKSLASGLYFYRLHAGDKALTKKMILMK